MTPESVQSLLCVAVGFGVAGLLASGYQLITGGPISFRMIGRPERSAALAAVPLLVFAAPFIIMRNTIRGRRQERRHVSFVALATMIAGFWSLMSGTVVASGWAGLVALFA